MELLLNFLFFFDFQSVCLWIAKFQIARLTKICLIPMIFCDYFAEDELAIEVPLRENFMMSFINMTSEIKKK